MKRVIVIGSPGAGKSVFSRSLQKITRLPLYHLDLIFHKSERESISRREFDAKLDEILALDEWIIDGNYQRTLKRRLERCDTAFLLDYPADVCLQGAQARIGTKRDDLPWIETSLDEEFRRQILSFPEKSLPEIYAMTEDFGGRLIIFKARNEADLWLKTYARGE